MQGAPRCLPHVVNSTVSIWLAYNSNSFSKLPNPRFLYCETVRCWDLHDDVLQDQLLRPEFLCILSHLSFQSCQVTFAITRLITEPCGVVLSVDIMKSRSARKLRAEMSMPHLRNAALTTLKSHDKNKCWWVSSAELHNTQRPSFQISLCWSISFVFSFPSVACQRQNLIFGIIWWCHTNFAHYSPNSVLDRTTPSFHHRPEKWSNKGDLH